MQLGSSFLCRRVLVPAVMMIVGSYGFDRAAAQEGGRALIIPLAEGAAAAWLRGLNPRPEVLVAPGDEGTVLAFVLADDAQKVNDKIDALRVDEVEGCGPEEGTCCDQRAHIFVLPSEYQGQPLWLSLGGHCEPWPDQDGRTDQPPFNVEPGVPLIRLESHIWDELVRLGAKEGSVMPLAASNHDMRMLVAPSWQSSDLSLPRHLGLRTLLPIILVNHVNSTTNPPGPNRPPGGCATSDYCRSYSNRRCYADRHQSGTAHSARHHWYVKTIDGSWCEQTDKCNCP